MREVILPEVECHSRAVQTSMRLDDLPSSIFKPKKMSVNDQREGRAAWTCYKVVEGDLSLIELRGVIGRSRGSLDCRCGIEGTSLHGDERGWDV